MENKLKRYDETYTLLQTIAKLSEETDNLEINQCDSEQLLIRNTESFRCLAQHLLSSSSITRNRLFLFPPLEDPGIKLALDFVEPVIKNDEIGVEIYEKKCRELGCVSFSAVTKSLEKNILNLKYYGLGIKQIKAITEALKSNARVTDLILENNLLSPNMISIIGDMMVENTTIQYISFEKCRIGKDGAQKLGEVLSSVQSLRSLNLSFNGIGDEGLLSFQDGLCGNTSLKLLDLSHNNLTDESGEILSKILTENKTIEDLNLSWNEYFGSLGNKRIFGALNNTDRVKYLNLQWNGIASVACVKPIAQYIKNSAVLKELDLSNNRLAGLSIRLLRNAILKNISLQTVKLGNNVYDPEETHLLLTAFAAKTDDSLLVMDLDNMYIRKDTKAVLNKIEEMGKIVKIGGILSDYEIQGPNVNKLIYDRCRYILMKAKNPKARKDFGHFILSLPAEFLTTEEFERELQKRKLKKLDKDLVQALIDLFITHKKTIDCAALIKDYLFFYPNTTLPPPKVKLKTGTKKKKKA